MGNAESGHSRSLATLRDSLASVEHRISTLNDARLWRQQHIADTGSRGQAFMYGHRVTCQPGVEVVTGPVVGKVGERDAIVLLEVSRSTRVECCVSEVSSAHPFGKAIARETRNMKAYRPAPFWLTGLKPGHRYVVVFSGVDRDVVESRVARFTTPSALERVTHLYAVADNDPGRLKSKEPSRWEQLCVRVKAGLPTAVLHLGAQVNGTHVFLRALSELTALDDDGNASSLQVQAVVAQAETEFRELYRQAWNMPFVREVLASCSNMMIWSDRDICDGFGVPGLLEMYVKQATQQKSGRVLPEEAVKRRLAPLLKVAQQVFREYQHQLIDPEGAGLPLPGGKVESFDEEKQRLHEAVVAAQEEAEQESKRSEEAAMAVENALRSIELLKDQHQSQRLFEERDEGRIDDVQEMRRAHALEQAEEDKTTLERLAAQQKQVAESARFHAKELADLEAELEQINDEYFWHRMGDVGLFMLDSKGGRVLPDGTPVSDAPVFGSRQLAVLQQVLALPDLRWFVLAVDSPLIDPAMALEHPQQVPHGARAMKDEKGKGGEGMEAEDDAEELVEHPLTNTGVDEGDVENAALRQDFGLHAQGLSSAAYEVGTEALGAFFPTQGQLSTARRAAAASEAGGRLEVVRMLAEWKAVVPGRQAIIVSRGSGVSLTTLMRCRLKTAGGGGLPLTTPGAAAAEEGSDGGVEEPLVEALLFDGTAAQVAASAVSDGVDLVQLTVGPVAGASSGFAGPLAGMAWYERQIGEEWYKYEKSHGAESEEGKEEAGGSEGSQPLEAEVDLPSPDVVFRHMPEEAGPCYGVIGIARSEAELATAKAYYTRQEAEEAQLEGGGVGNALGDESGRDGEEKGKEEEDGTLEPEEGAVVDVTPAASVLALPQHGWYSYVVGPAVPVNLVSFVRLLRTLHIPGGNPLVSVSDAEVAALVPSHRGAAVTPALLSRCLAAASDAVVKAIGLDNANDNDLRPEWAFARDLTKPFRVLFGDSSGGAGALPGSSPWRRLGLEASEQGETEAEYVGDMAPQVQAPLDFESEDAIAFKEGLQTSLEAVGHGTVSALLSKLEVSQPATLFPRVLVGPVIGRVLPTAAIVLLEVATSAEVSFEARDPVSQHCIQRSMEVPSRRPTSFVLSGLRPGTYYELRVFGVAAAEAYSGSFTTPHMEPEDATFLVISGQRLVSVKRVGGTGNTLSEKVSAGTATEIWRELAETIRIPGQAPTAIITLGNQVEAWRGAATAVRTIRMKERLNGVAFKSMSEERKQKTIEAAKEGFRDVYRRAWTKPYYREVLANVPHLMAVGDGELDVYPSSAKDGRGGIHPEALRAGLDAEDLQFMPLLQHLQREVFREYCRQLYDPEPDNDLLTDLRQHQSQFSPGVFATLQGSHGWEWHAHVWGGLGAFVFDLQHCYSPLTSSVRRRDMAAPPVGPSQLAGLRQFLSTPQLTSVALCLEQPLLLTNPELVESAKTGEQGFTQFLQSRRDFLNHKEALLDVLHSLWEWQAAAKGREVVIATGSTEFSVSTVLQALQPAAVAQGAEAPKPFRQLCIGPMSTPSFAFPFRREGTLTWRPPAATAQASQGLLPSLLQAELQPHLETNIRLTYQHKRVELRPSVGFVTLSSVDPSKGAATQLALAAEEKSPDEAAGAAATALEDNGRPGAEDGNAGKERKGEGAQADAGAEKEAKGEEGTKEKEREGEVVEEKGEEEGDAPASPASPAPQALLPREAGQEQTESDDVLDDFAPEMDSRGALIALVPSCWEAVAGLLPGESGRKNVLRMEAVRALAAAILGRPLPGHSVPSSVRRQGNEAKQRIVAYIRSWESQRAATVAAIGPALAAVCTSTLHDVTERATALFGVTYEPLTAVGRVVEGQKVPGIRLPRLHDAVMAAFYKLLLPVHRRYLFPPSRLIVATVAAVWEQQVKFHRGVNDIVGEVLYCPASTFGDFFSECLYAAAAVHACKDWVEEEAQAW